jgi:hypothetical protein
LFARPQVIFSSHSFRFSIPSRLSQPKEQIDISETSTLIGYSGHTIGREELALVPTPPATENQFHDLR